MLYARSAAIVLSILFAIVAPMSGCSSKGASVMNLHFACAPIGVEIDFALFAQDAGAPSSQPTSQPSSIKETAE